MHQPRGTLPTMRTAPSGAQSPRASLVRIAPIDLESSRLLQTTPEHIHAVYRDYSRVFYPSFVQSIILAVSTLFFFIYKNKILCIKLLKSFWCQGQV